MTSAKEQTHPPIILASGSPRRQWLLSTLGLPFALERSDVEETFTSQEDPINLVRRLSLAKARSVAAKHPGALIIAADTIVVLDGQVLGKPRDAAHAQEILSRLRGRWHQVYSGLTLLDTLQQRECLQHAITPVRMRHYSDQEIQRYVASGDPLDKAGAYAIQHAEFAPIAEIAGCYANVVGFPLCHLYRLLCAWGITPPIHPLQACPFAQEHDGCPWAEEILSAAQEEWCPREKS